jgi:hypothetical protein
MDLMAGLTGGTAFFGDEIQTVLDQIARNAAESYSAVYDPSEANWDHTFHTIRLTAQRPGITPHARQRYFADPDPRSPPVRQKAALNAAVESLSDLPYIDLRVTVAQRTPKTVRFQILIQPAYLVMREDGDNFSARLSIAFSDLGAHGPLSAPAVTSFDLRLTREQRDLVIQSGILLAPDHPIPDLTQKVRIVVLDQATDSVGSITVPVAAAPK